MKNANAPFAPAHVRRRPGRREHGLTLIELLVSLVIGLVLSLAVAGALIASEGLRRTSTSVNDLNLSGNVVAFQLDRTLRTAGSGFSQRWPETYGCRVLASRTVSGVTTQVLPRTAAFPAPFAGVPVTVRLAPVLIRKGAANTGGDVLVVMAGTSGFSEASVRPNTGSVTANSLLLPTALGIRASDLMLVSDTDLGDCMVQQVAAGHVATAAQTVNLGGQMAAASVAGVNLAAFGTTGRSLVSLLGNADNNPPAFTMFGVGANDTLMSFDLLRVAANDTGVVRPFYENVVEMRALYGVTNAGNLAGTVDQWIDPLNTDVTWSYAALTNGSAASAANLRRIVAVRVGLIVRAALPEREIVSPATVVLFGDLPAAQRQTRTLTAAERNMRMRTFDFTVPLRTVQLQALP